jgi:hypothetical protein
MQYLEFRNNSCIDTTLDINHFNKSIVNVTYTKFLDWATYDNPTWDNHADHLTSKLNSACYTITAVKAGLSEKALRMLYFSYVHSIISNISIFWEGHTPKSIKIFRMKKKKLSTVL